MTRTSQEPAPVDPVKIKEHVEMGDLPSNEELSEALKTAKRAEAEIMSRQGELSGTGRAVMEDVQGIIETAEKIVREKNEGEALQETVKHAIRSGSISVQGTGGLASAFSSDQINNELNEGKASLATIARLTITSSEFREAISDFLEIVQSYLSSTRGDKERESSQGERAGFPEGAPESREGRGDESTSMPISEHTRTLIADRFYNLMTDLQSRPEFQRAASYFIDRFVWLHESVKSGEWRDYWDKQDFETWDPAQREAWEAAKNAQKLIENWAGMSLEPVIGDLVGFIDKTKDDQALVDSIEQLGHFLKNCLTEEGYLNDRNWIMSEISERLETIKTASWDRYRHEIDRMQREVSEAIDRLKRDPASVSLQQDISSLYQHLFLDSEGRPSFKPELIADLRIVIPAVLRQLMHVRSPDITYSDDQIDFSAANVIVNVSELAPSQLRLSYVADFAAMQRQVIRSEGSTNLIKIELYGVHAHADNITYSLNKHHGFPLWRDTGRADVRIYGRGMDIGILMEPVMSKASATSKEATGGLAIMDAKCIIHALDLKLYETQHDWMYTVIGPVVRSMLKSRLEGSLAESIKAWDLTTTVPIPESIGSSVPVEPLESPDIPFKSMHPEV